MELESQRLKKLKVEFETDDGMKHFIEWEADEYNNRLVVLQKFLLTTERKGFSGRKDTTVELKAVLQR